MIQPQRPAGTAPWAGPPPVQVEQSDPASRGLTRIAPTVVERVAAFACRGVAGVVREHPRSDGVKPPTVRARADVMGSRVHLSVRLPVDYPRSLITVSLAARQAVSETVHHMCGLHVDGVDIEAVPVNRMRRARVR